MRDPIQHFLRAFECERRSKSMKIMALLRSHHRFYCAYRWVTLIESCATLGFTKILFCYGTRILLMVGPLHCPVHRDLANATANKLPLTSRVRRPLIGQWRRPRSVCGQRSLLASLSFSYANGFVSAAQERTIMDARRISSI